MDGKVAKKSVKSLGMGLDLYWTVQYNRSVGGENRRLKPRETTDAVEWRVEADDSDDANRNRPHVDGGHCLSGNRWPGGSM
jgi:hypothetical protein